MTLASDTSINRDAWHEAFDRLDRISRTRSLTEQESRYLETAIWHLENPARQCAEQPAPGRVARYAALEAYRRGLPLHEVTGHKRSRKAVEARRAVWRRLHSDGFSYAAIGRATGHHHTSVMHGLGVLT